MMNLLEIPYLHTLNQVKVKSIIYIIAIALVHHTCTQFVIMS